METEFNLYYKGEFIGTHSMSELAQKLNLSASDIINFAEKRKKYQHHRWTKIHNSNLIENKHMDSELKKLYEEWDEFTEPYRNRK